ncbi:MAG: O-phosphoseryl-tRNA(Sec) selenium transferase [Candidatus Thorarchaeota archaeon]|nr:MAG: O-phosphoseryl-tRNA(Sec) selenium transferase [Candidatus Thorarchaeota archaeon]
MNKDLTEYLLDLIPKSMLERGRTSLEARLSPIRDVLNRQHFPDSALSEWQIEQLLNIFASMDSDKDPIAARVGEREGRTASSLVSRLAGGFNHGIGRSGHITAPQPKAAGASLMQRLTNNIVLDAIQKLGLSNIRAGIVMPLSTGMSIALALGMLHREQNVSKVLYTRIDHTSSKRGIALAGLDMILVDTMIVDDAVRVDMGDLEKKINRSENICVLGTSTFFAPRETDPVKEIAKICLDFDVPFIINNAYGIQSKSVMAMIRSAIDAGRVDAVIQSTDKNFLTPVGGSIITSPSENTIELVAETYAGRATAAPLIQLLAALLSLGLHRYTELRSQQQENRIYLETLLDDLADEVNQRVLEVENPVSCAVTMDDIDVRELGARLYNHRVTGPRAVEKDSYGSCVDGYPHNYIVMNAAIGSRREDIETAVSRLGEEIRSL